MNKFDENSPFLELPTETKSQSKSSFYQYELESYSPFLDWRDELLYEQNDLNLQQKYLSIEEELMDGEYENEQNKNTFRSNLNIQEELSGDELEKAVNLNRKYMIEYGWQKYAKDILKQIGITNDDWITNSSEENLKTFTKFFANWQDKNGYKTSYKGVFGLNNWTYFQKKIGLHNLSNRHNINIEKAISDNKYYEKKTWGSEKENVYKFLADNKIVKIPLPLNDEYFAYAIADFQALKGIKVDGILGPITFGKMKSLPPVSPIPATPVLSRWHSLIKNTIQCNAEAMVGGNETMRNIVAAIRTANAPGHYIYILGWMLDVDFCLIPNDQTTKLKSLLKDAVDKGAEVRALIWGNPTYIRTDEIARDTINGLTSTKGGSGRMILDNNTFGSDTVKNAIIRVKEIIAGIPSPVTDLLSRIDAWNELNATLDLVRNEGSHHEKVLIVKGSEGMIGFAGGIDINSNRVDALKGVCCGTDPKTGLPYPPDHFCNLTISIGNVQSDVLRDVNCKVRDEGAWKLLQQFMRRWYSYKASPRFSLVPDIYLYNPLKGAAEPKPVSTTNSNIKVVHTFNSPTNVAIKDRSIWDTLKIAIDNAKKKIYFEDQYMISCEIADRLNARLMDPSFENLTILIQSDQLASELMFPNKMRSAFLRRLYNGIPQDTLDKKVFIKMLDPNMPLPLHRRMHSKIYIIDDDLAIIGSANCSNRSMIHDSETNIVIFNDDLSKKNFVAELNTKLLSNEVANKIKYDPEETKRSADLSVKDLDERIIVGVRNFVANADLKTLVAMKLLNLDSLPQLIITTVKALRPFVLQVVEPYSNCGVFDVGADYELENLFTEEMMNFYEFEKKYKMIHTGEMELTQQLASPFIDNAEALEQETVSGSSVSTCEGRTCWAKTVLNKLLGLSLPLNNTLDEATKKAIANFQVKNNLSQTRTIDAVTERALLEEDSIQKQGASAAKIITEAKTRIEDWMSKGVSGVKNKPQHILNSFRDPRKVWAFVLHHMAFKRKGPKTKQYSDPDGYVNTGAHFCIMLDGRIIQLHPVSRMIWHSNCTSPRSVGVEFEGNFPNIKGKWWIDKDLTVQNKDVPTHAQYDSGRFLASYLKTILGTTHILAHRQSSDSRENDPGPDIWYNVGQWAIDNLRLTDGGPSFKCGTGSPILPEWRIWGSKSANISNEFNNSIDTEEWEADTEILSHLNENVEDYFPEHQDFDSEMDELVKDWSNAVRLNLYYADKLGWNQFHDKINDMLLPLSGLQNVSLGEESFAQVVAEWQQQQGFSANDCDGIIGPITWAKMKPLLVVSSTTTPVTATTGSPLPSAIDSRVVARLKAFSADIESISNQHGLNPNVVRGIIAAESGGNLDTGKGTSGYKGLMQAERTIDQLQPATSIRTGVAKFIEFSDKILNPWLTKLQIGIPPATDENYLKACLSCYNAGPVTAMKAIQYAHAAGDWKKWLSAEHYLRALLFSGGYDRYSKCNQGLSATQFNAASTERLKYKFKTRGWRTELDPPVWSSVITVLNPVTRCWIETKFTNTPDYLDRFINYLKYFDANPQASQPEVADESLQYQESESNEWSHDEVQDEMFEESGESFEIEEQVNNWSKAIELNRNYGVRLGWNQLQDQINDFLLLYSGLQNVSLGEEAFAMAVAEWQRKQGFSEKDCDGVIGPNTWRVMQPFILRGTLSQPTKITPASANAPSLQNVFDFNRWYAQRILDNMNTGIISQYFDSKSQLQSIVNGVQVNNVNPKSKIIQVLPIIYHISEQARINNYREITIGSFIRDAKADGTCIGHCEGRCIDINYAGGSFEKFGATQMVINILTYLLLLPIQFRKSLGFGMPVQGDFFGHKNLSKFKSVNPSNLINSNLKQLVPQLGYVFPDNDNHLHIQVKWNSDNGNLQNENLVTNWHYDEEIGSNIEVELVAQDFNEEQRKIVQNQPDILFKNIQNPAQPVILVRAESTIPVSNEMLTFYKMYDKVSKKFIGECFDQQGNKVTLSDIRTKENELPENVNNKIHPTLQLRTLKTADPDPIDIAVWMNLEVKEPLKTNYRPEELVTMPAEIADYRRKLAVTIGDMTRKVTIERSGIQVQRISDLLPLFFAKATKRTIDLIKNDPLVLGIFFNDRSYFESLNTSLSRSGATEAQIAGMTNLGKEIKVAVWENAPDLLTDLTIEGYYDSATPNVSNHSRLVCAIIKNKEPGKSKGYAPNCKLYSANLSGTDVFAPLEWAVKQGCTVINRSFHQDTDQVNAGMQLSDFITDALALSYPYPMIVQASGNTGQPDDTALVITPPGNEYVNHKGYNSIAVGSHDDQIDRRISAFSTFRNPSSPHGDRELPEICALGENISAVGLVNWGGTSFASPAVAGSIALLQSLSAILKLYPEVTRALLLVGSKRNVDGGLWYADLKQTPKVDQKDGTGALNIYESITIAKKPYQLKKVALDKGWDYGKLDASSFGPDKISTREWKIIVPHNRKHVKIALAWNSNANYIEIWAFKFLKDTTLDMDLDIVVYDDKNKLIATSSSFDNSFEIADYIAQGGQTLTVKVRGYSIKQNAWTYFGIAWTTF